MSAGQDQPDGASQERAGRAPPRFASWCAIALAGSVLLLLTPLIVAFFPRGAPVGTAPGALETMLPKTGPLVLNSLLASAGVGVCATGLGLAVAWTTRGLRGAGLLSHMAVLLPLMLPAYLSYSGWSVLRAPGSWLGDWIGSLPGTRAGDVGRAANIGFAILGMTLWLWPLAAVLVTANIRRLDADLFHMLRLESARGPARWWLVVRLLRPSILLSVVTIGILVMGTAIPLHVANVPTLAISVWLALDRSPPGEAWRALLAAWPLWTLAIVAGWWLGGRASDWATGNRATSSSFSVSHRQSILLYGATSLSVVIPAALLVNATRDSASLMRFWRISGDGVLHGLGLATATGVIVALIAIATGVAVGSRAWAASVGKGFVRVMLMLGFAPGVLIGTGLVSGWNRLDSSGFVTSGVMIEGLAQVCRYGWIGAIAGCAMVRMEHPHLRDLRQADGAETLAGFARTGLLLNLPILAASGLATGMLSFTEIEATVVVQPPGTGNLARHILNYLHFARMEEMSAAAAWIVGSGILLTAVIGWLLMLVERAKRTSGEVS
ncbi:MAG: hypothetical protein KF912_11900 [Phycisphaeraceae bacterium]|nr:hypothetical protein [Phycisphaeraceae bacterium]MBX3368005.1 hypothetical protein [Phycisphaeraceae bacterium]